MEQQELDLRELFFVIRRRLALIIALPVIAAIVAGLVSIFVLTPIYEAETTLWVVKEDGAQITYNDVLLSRNLTKTYAEVAKSRTVMNQVIRRVGLQGVTPEDLRAKLKVTPVRDTDILSFKVADPDPAWAARLADAIAAAFKDHIRSFIKVENVVVVDPAVVPTDPVKPQVGMNVAVAFVLGGIGAAGLVLLLEYLDTSIKTPDDVTRCLGLPVLATIPVIPSGGRPAREAKRSRAFRLLGKREVDAG